MWNITGMRLRGGLLHLALISVIAGVIVSAAPSISWVAAQDQGVRGRDKIVAHTRLRGRRTGRKILKKQTVAMVNLLIASNPASKVVVDGESSGQTDLNGELELVVQPGIHVIRLSRDGFVSTEADVEVEPTPADQQVDFTLPALLVSLNIITDPPATEVYLDEVYKGSTNANGLLVIERVNPTESHSVRVRKDGFIKQPAVPITTYSGQISFRLSRDSLTLKLMTEPGEAEVYLDDAYKGTSTREGLLLIEKVDPSQSHRLRVVKREGFLQQSVDLQANQSEAKVKLLPDPIVLLIKNIKRQIAEGNLAMAFVGYDQLALDASDHSELPHLLENILQILQSRSTEMVRRVGFLGLPLDLREAQEMSQLYEQARKWRPSDENIDTFAGYWELKVSLANANQATSTSEGEASRSRARSLLIELAEPNLRNVYLLFDLGWAWKALNDITNAQKYFGAAQKLRPEWAYPHFAMGLLAMIVADAETNKPAKAAGYTQAIERFNKAISLQHDFARAYALRCLAYAALKQHEEAIGSGLQAVALAPQSSYAHFALGSAYFQSGKSKYPNAQIKLNQALTLNGSELDQRTKELIHDQLFQIKKELK